jgi:hypothetical protein
LAEHNTLAADRTGPFDHLRWTMRVCSRCFASSRKRNTRRMA